MISLGRAWVFVGVVAFSGSSCALLAPQPDPTRYAVLASVDELNGPAPSTGESTNSLQIGLGPISFPDYVRRTALVTREDGTRLVPSPTESWAEPFERSLERVLAIDLRRAKGVASVILHPWYETERPQVQVEIAFSRCERDSSCGVVVAAHWQVRWLDGSRALLDRETRLERPCPNADGAQVAKVISQALAELCAQIGESLR